MANNYDEAIKKNRQYLTQAQIDALVAASQQYNNQNAGNRAGALATAREQYDTGYRGLQNMGLAGATGAQPTSGEVPRLQQQIRTPFEDYNNRLRDVERQRLGVLGENYAAQTRAAWAAEAERRRQEEAYQRAVAAAQSMLSNIKTSITPSYVGPTLTDAEKAARKAQADGLKRTQQIKQVAVDAANKYQRDGINRTASPQVIAAAAAFGKGNATISQQSDRYEKAYKEADATVRGMEMTRRYGGTVNEQDYQAAVQTRNEADTNRILDNYRKNDPEMFSAILTANSSSASSEAKRKAYGVMAGRATADVVNAMGFQKTMSDKEFNDATKVIPDIRMQLNIIDSTRNRMSNGGTGGEKTIEEAIAELKKLGYTEDEARGLVEKYNNDRNFMREYDYLNGAYTALYEHQGEKPTKPVNDKETDVTYRVVNRLPNKRSGASIDTETARYMTDEQRDMYNAVFEKEGAAAANEFAKAIVPIVEMKRAEEDQQWLEKLATEKGFPAWLLARGANLVGSIPAMVEKLAVNAQNISAGATGELKKYSPNSGTSRLSNWADIVQSKQSQNILEYYDKQERPGMGKFMNFMYNTGTSMADSLIAMGASGVLGSVATDALFFSSAGNQAYKDAIQRGATQEQAMGLSFLSGTAEALFEHVSLEKLTQTLKFRGKPMTQAIKDAFTQAGVEGSEELFTEIANVLSDFAIMKDKSEMQEAIDNGELGTYLWDHLSSATLGGLASGLLFGLAGVGGTAWNIAKESRENSKLGNQVRENSDVQQVKNAAVMLGGEAMRQAESVQKKETDANVGEMTATVVNEIQSLGKELSQDQQVGLTRVLDGAEMTTQEASDVHELLGKETLERMNYDAATPEAFQKSYNDRVQKYGVTSRAEAMQQAAEKRFNKQKKEAASRVWANPEQGLSLTTPEGGAVRPMPGNMTAVALAEQERTGFKTRASAVKGNVTYAVAGMEAREGMSNEQTYSEIQKGLVKEARQKAQLYEKLASALGVKMIIHDVMTGTNGFIDEKGNVHVVLSGRQSVLRVAAHELTHYMKDNAKAEYSALRSHLIAEVGNDKFDRMVKRKASEYGIDLSTEKGKILADDEVCAELCERMLSNEEALEKFAEKDLPAAKTLKEQLIKILNAIKDAFKRAENRDFGESWSDLIRQQDTIESWITGLQKAIDNANARSNTVEGQIAKTAGVTTVDQAQMDEDMREELFLDEDASAAESRREKAKANAEKGTKVDGITDDEMSRILDRSVYGDKSNYDRDDFKSVQSMLAQLVPEAIDALNGNADLDEVYAEIKTAVGEMLDKYYLDEGDHSALRELIPEVIAVDSTAKSDLKAQDASLFQMSSKLKKALGRKVTLVGPTNEKFKSAMKLEELWHSAQDRLGLSDYQDFSVDTQKLLDFVQSQTAVRDFDSLHKSERDNIVTYQANEFVSAVDEMLAERVDKVIAEHSVDVIEYDMAGYRADLEQKGLMSKGELDELFTTMKKAVKYVKEHRAILDFGEELNTEEDIVAAKQNRAYLPYKQNADPHYKLALDFSTLCKKRILLQMIQERLQGKLKRSLSALETIAIRREILKLQKNGVDVEVACALCYVEAARMKSHKVIDEFLGVGMTKAGRAANVEAEMRNYFAQKDKDIKKVIDKDLAKWKEAKLGKDWTGFTKSGKKVGAANASKDHLKAFGGQKLVDEYNAFAKGTRSKAKVNDAQEEIIKEAKRLVQETPEAFLSAESLAKMKKSNPDIFYAFVNKVRSATRSKALETDTFYSRGDIDMVDEAIIRAANQESGFRHQSWSDFMPIHLLDTMASVIEMSQRDAKMHAYTKVPAMVELLGNTGMMLNMSMIPKGATGLKADGTLDFDSVEGMDWDTMMNLRDLYPNTAGNIAIGISDEQIKKLLDSRDIDYVIPYHASGMNQTLRTHMNIEHWVEYTKTQNEVEKDGYAPDGKTWKEKHKKGKMKPPALARWFDADEARGVDGYAYMQKASEKYIDICNKEGWIPKFPQYLTKDADGNYHLNDEYKNYWKMLTDRKMVNHLTGKVIIQQAVKPKFNEQTVMDILKGEAENPTAIRNAAAADEIAGELAKTWRADRENANLKSYKAELNAFREASAVMAADRVKEDVKRRLAETRNSIDTDYMRLAEKQKNGTLTKEDESNLRKMVDDAANAAGYTIKAYHGSRAIFTEFSDEMRGSSTKTQASKKWHFAADYETANSYYPAGAMRELIKQRPSWFSQKDLDSMDRRGVSGKLYPLYLKMNNPLVVDVAGYDYESHKANKDAMMEYVEQADREGRDGIILTHVRDNNLRPEAEESTDYMFRSSSQAKLADLVTYDKNGNIIPLSERFRTDRTGDESWKNQDIRYDLDTDAIRQAFTVIDTAGIEDGLEALKDVKHVGSFALKDITRFLDASAGKNKDLRNTLHAIFEAPHSEATGRYARGVERMQQKVLDIGKRAGVCDEKGKHFDSKKSAAIQNIGEGFSNTYTDLKLKVKDADHVTVKAYEPGTDNLVDSEKDYTLKELRQAYGTNAADYVWSRVFDETQKAQETGGKPSWVDEKVNTRPYTIDDLQTAYPNDWQKLKAAADEFRQMYDEYIRDQNNMLATIYPIESEYADVEKLDAGIEKKQERLAQHKAAVDTQIENLQKSLEAKEKEIASKKRTDTKAYRQLVEQANKLTDKIAEVKAEIAEYEANVKDELVKMNTLKAEMQNAVQKGDYSLKRMHRLQYRSDYFHHFTEMASGIQNLKSIFTNNTDIAPAIVGKSENTKAKTKWAGYFQQRMGGDYTADALNGMLRYGQLAEYKLAFDPLTAYLRDVNKQIRNMSSDTNRDGLIRYIDQWADTIAGKSHKLDRVVSDSGMAPRKAMQVLQWINSRVIQNTLLFNMRSALVQISNITNAKGIVKNNIDWVNGLKAWALAAKGDEAMASIMAQSNFLASRYMDGLALTDSKLKSAKQFAGWMLGALDEVSAKATWWAAYQQYTRNPNAAKNQYRNYEDAIDYADDITRRTHAGRGVGELAPAMTSRVINFVAPFQVEVNNTWQLLKDNVKQKNYLGLLSTGLSVFLFNTFFEAIVGSTPLGFDFIRAVVDIALGFLNDDPDDDPDAKEIGQRFAGELVGGLPFASQLVAAFGEDNAKKLLGENNDATRYGNTQIGVSAVVNAAKGLKDIGTGLIEGRRVNWIDDLDDLMNLTLPMGAKQLTRTAQGLATVAKGYAGKYDKAGDEKVQFVTDQDVLHYIHAGLFGKWALTEASEYFGEKRLLPQLFGKYNGPKSSIGNMVDAKEYKAALKTGIDGKQYFTVKYDLKKYTTQAGKRAEMMEQPFTSEQKAQLDALLIADSKKGSKAEGSVVYQKDNDGNWAVKADYTSSDWMDVAELGDTKYNQAKESGIKPETFASICTAWKGMSGKDKKDQAREYLNGLHLTKDQYDYIWTNVFKYKAE